MKVSSLLHLTNSRGFFHRYPDDPDLTFAVLPELTPYTNLKDDGVTPGAGKSLCQFPKQYPKRCVSHFI